MNMGAYIYPVFDLVCFEFRKKAFDGQNIPDFCTNTSTATLLPDSA